MRSWQPVIGVLLGFLLGKVLSMAIFWLPGMILAAGNLGAGSGMLVVLAIMTLVLVTGVAGVVWLFVNFFMISGWLPKAAAASSLMSAIMIVYTAVVALFCETLGWFGAICAPPFWVHGWF